MVSPESLPSSCGRKSSLKSSNKEENNAAAENGRIIPTGGEDSTFGNNGLLTRKSSSPSSKTQIQAQTQTQAHYNHNHLNTFSHFSPSYLQSPQQQNHHPGESGHHSTPNHSRGGGGTVGGGCVSGDVLLQWGQRKRSRCSRTEARSSSSVEKLTTNITSLAPPPPPPPSLPPTSSIRTGARHRPNGVLSGKDIASGKNRNLEDPMGVSPSKNGGSNRAIAMSRSTVGKRSSSSVDKADKKGSTSGSIRKEKSDDSNHHNVEENGGVVHLATPGGGGGSGGAVDDGEKCNGGGGGEVVEWPRIYVSLSRKEKEDDFYAMKGTKLPHRPKKRAKAIDRTLQYCFPGLWLSDLTRARYEVRERKSAKKQPKRRGLKGLESMDSDSE